jgi:hypothetical protein
MGVAAAKAQAWIVEEIDFFSARALVAVVVRHAVWRRAVAGKKKQKRFGSALCNGSVLANCRRRVLQAKIEANDRTQRAKQMEG